MFYHRDVTICEGAGVNNGWADCRDRHLGPELKAFENLEFGHSNRHVHVHQHYADGTQSDWTGPPSKGPASITKLVAK